ncbi:MAG: hypothetical protein HYU86_09540 [Chloroflexi bacterium]|nr:hypothetical protein [Chloroflexota bacterium]
MQTQKWSERVLRNLETAAEHTKEVVKKLVLLAIDKPGFETQYQLGPDVVCPTCDEERDYLVLVAFMHDVHKLLDGRDHASRGADVAAKPETVDLIRFHDVLGVASTGEASPLFLADLVSAVRRHASPRDFLRRLLILTTVDVAAAGFLTQERLENYAYLLSLVQEAGRSNNDTLSELAMKETGERIKRLLQSNDRIEVESVRLIDAAFDRHSNGGKLRNALAFARFHYGAWALEPWFWRRLGQQEPRPNDEQKKNRILVEDGEGSVDLLDQFLNLLWRIVNNEDSREIKREFTTVAGKKLSLYNLEGLSVKFGSGTEGYDNFLKWCMNGETKLP